MDAPDEVVEIYRQVGEWMKPGDPIFRRSRSEMILSNRDLRAAAVRAGFARGLAAEAIPHDLTGPVELARPWSFDR